MARIAGVKTVKNSRGNITHVTIDMRKHPQAFNTLQQMGLLEKTQFEKDFEMGIPATESRKISLRKLKDRWDKL